MNLLRLRSLALVAALVATGSAAFAGSATNVTGLYFTGQNNSGGLLAGGQQDSHWTVMSADVANTAYSGTSTYTGSSYVVSSSYIDAGWVQNTTSAQWIVPPGAKSAATGGTTNTGGDFLPGNGTSGNNDAKYFYVLAFTITGTGSGTVTNNVSISLTIAADDQYKIYVNPTANWSTATVSSTAAATRSSAWNNTQAEYLTNYTYTDAQGVQHAKNVDFQIGTNYLVVEVDNTNSINGTSNSTALNPSGLLVYQTGSAILINGSPIPEVGQLLPVLGALGVFVVRRFRRRDSASAPATA